MRIEINIGLQRQDGKPINVLDCVLALNKRGFTLMSGRTVEAVHEFGTESTLVCEVFRPAGYWGRNWKQALFDVSVELGQDCIAALPWPSDDGHLVGPNADRWGAFNKEYFIPATEPATV